MPQRRKCSIVRAWMDSLVGKRSGSVRRSISTHRTPRQASSLAKASPTGPAPRIATGAGSKRRSFSVVDTPSLRKADEFSAVYSRPEFRDEIRRVDLHACLIPGECGALEEGDIIRLGFVIRARHFREVPIRVLVVEARRRTVIEALIGRNAGGGEHFVAL